MLWDDCDLVDTWAPTCGFKSMILSFKNLGQFHLLVPNITSFNRIIYRMVCLKAKKWLSLYWNKKLNSSVGVNSYKDNYIITKTTDSYQLKNCTMEHSVVLLALPCFLKRGILYQKSDFVPWRPLIGWLNFDLKADQRKRYQRAPFLWELKARFRVVFEYCDELITVELTQKPW